MTDNSHDPLRAMAATIWGEARGELFLGQVGVAWVIQARANNPGWWGGPSIQSVCLARHQFSCWHDNQAARVRSVGDEDPRFQQAMTIAIGVLRHGYPIDPTLGADHYYAPAGMPGGQPPRWAVGESPTAIIGGHRFYRLGKGA